MFIIALLSPIDNFLRYRQKLSIATVLTDINTVTLYGMWKSSIIKYNIQYNTNGGSVVSATTGEALPNATITLSNIIPTLSGFSFEGWCSTYNSSDKTNCNGKIYQRNGSYPLSNGSNITLYAIWKKIDPCPGGTTRMNDGKYWCKTDAGSFNWEEAKKVCALGNYHLPTQAEFIQLLGSYCSLGSADRGQYCPSGNGASSFRDAWIDRSGSWWTSTEIDSNNAYNIWSNGESFIYTYIDGRKTHSLRVRCVSN